MPSCKLIIEANLVGGDVLQETVRCLTCKTSISSHAKEDRMRWFHKKIAFLDRHHSEPPLEQLSVSEWLTT